MTRVFSSVFNVKILFTSGNALFNQLNNTIINRMGCKRLPF